MIKARTLIKRIKMKFGTFSRFCRIANLNEYDTRLVLSNWRNFQTSDVTKGQVQQIEAKYLDTEDVDADSRQITPDDRTFIAMMVKRYYTNVQVFTDFHPQFSNATIYQILGGSRKRKTKIVKEVIEVLKYKHANK